jgi:hypothetical protein
MKKQATRRRHRHDRAAREQIASNHTSPPSSPRRYGQTDVRAGDSESQLSRLPESELLLIHSDRILGDLVPRQTTQIRATGLKCEKMIDASRGVLSGIGARPESQARERPDRRTH